MSVAASSLTIKRARTAEEVAAVRGIFEDYLVFIENYLGQSLSFQGTKNEFATFPDVYDALFLAKLNGAAVAACGVKPFKADICELKRLYCRPEGRGHQLGEKLTLMAIEFSKIQNYDHMYLDTDAGLTHANSIYESLGFKDIDRYYGNPMGCSRYMALKL